MKLCTVTFLFIIHLVSLLIFLLLFFLYVYHDLDHVGDSHVATTCMIGLEASPYDCCAINTNSTYITSYNASSLTHVTFFSNTTCSLCSSSDVSCSSLSLTRNNDARPCCDTQCCTQTCDTCVSYHIMQQSYECNCVPSKANERCQHCTRSVNQTVYVPCSCRCLYSVSNSLSSIHCNTCFRAIIYTLYAADTSQLDYAIQAEDNNNNIDSLLLDYSNDSHAYALISSMYAALNSSSSTFSSSSNNNNNNNHKILRLQQSHVECRDNTTCISLYNRLYNTNNNSMISSPCYYARSNLSSPLLFSFSSYSPNVPALIYCVLFGCVAVMTGALVAYYIWRLYSAEQSWLSHAITHDSTTNTTTTKRSRSTIQRQMLRNKKIIKHKQQLKQQYSSDYQHDNYSEHDTDTRNTQHDHDRDDDDDDMDNEQQNMITVKTTTKPPLSP